MVHYECVDNSLCVLRGWDPKPVHEFKVNNHFQFLSGILPSFKHVNFQSTISVHLWNRAASLSFADLVKTYSIILLSKQYGHMPFIFMAI